MKALLVLAMAVTVGLIVTRFRQTRNIRHLVVTLQGLIYVAGAAFVGMEVRAIPLLFLAHSVAVVVAWIGLIEWIWRGRFRWYLFVAPIATFASFWVNNYLGGQRYEA